MKRSQTLIVLLILLTIGLIVGLIVRTNIYRAKDSVAWVELVGAVTMKGAYKAECDMDKAFLESADRNERTHVRVSLGEGWVLNLYSPYYPDNQRNYCPPGHACPLIAYTLTPTLESSDRKTMYSIQNPLDGDFNLHFKRQENLIQVSGEMKTGEGASAKSVYVKATVTCEL